MLPLIKSLGRFSSRSPPVGRPSDFMRREQREWPGVVCETEEFLKYKGGAVASALRKYGTLFFFWIVIAATAVVDVPLYYFWCNWSAD